MLRYLIITALVLPGMLTAADNEMLSMSLPDLERSRERFMSSPYGQCYFAEDMDGVRQRIEELLAMAQQRTQVDWRQLITRSTGAELGVYPPADRNGEPGMQFLLRGTDAATSLYSLAVQFLPELESGTVADAPGIAISDAGLVIAANGALVQTRAPTISEDDLTVRWNRDAIIAAIEANSRPRDAAGVALVADLMPRGQIGFRLVPEGMEQRLQLDAAPAGLKPVDRAVLAKLPAGVLAAYAVGLDGAAWWQAHGPAVLAAAADEQGVAPEMIAQQATGLLAGFGIANGFDGLAAGFNGSAVLVVGHSGGLIPSLSLALPRSAAIDALINFALVSSGNQNPAEGKVTFLTFPEGRRIVAPGVALARDAKHWWLSTDALFLHEVFNPTSETWDTTSVGKAALAAAGPEASIIGGGDSQAVIRSLLPLAVFGAGFPDSGAHLQALAHAATRFARDAGPDITVAQPTSDGWESLVRGPTGGLALLGSVPAFALFTAVAVPNLMESQTAAAQGAAQAYLRSGIFPAQAAFSASGFNDNDGDNRGEYGFLPQLAGAQPCFGILNEQAIAAGELEFLGLEFSDSPSGEINGYHFQVWLPDGQGSAVDYPGAVAQTNKGNSAGANDQERYFVAYAWPQIPGETGNDVYAITQEGVVYSIDAEALELPPSWNALFDYRVGEASEVFSQPRWEVE